MDEAVDVVVAETGDDPEAVRASLRKVAEDDVVERSGVDSAISHLSKVVSTPENRAEMAVVELADAREAADPVADVPAVAARLESFEARVDAATDGVEALTGDLQDLIERRETADLYSLGADVRRISGDADDLHGRVDRLVVEIEEFEKWLDDHERRREELAGDVEAVGEYLDGIAETLDEVEAPDDEVGDADADLGVAWFDAALRQRAAGLLIDDLRAEREDLRSLAERDEVDDPELEIEPGVEDLDGRQRRLGERVEGMAQEAWRDRFEDRLAAFEESLGGFEAPVDWGAVQTELERHRPDPESA